MKISLKSVVAVALTGVAALGAMTASADVALPTTGNGELTLFARDQVTGVVYARGLGVTINDIIDQTTSGGAYSGPTEISYSLPTIAADANMTAFLAAAGSNNIVWGIQTSDTVGDNRATNPRRIAFTTSVDLTTLTTPSNSTLLTTANGISGMLQGVNGNLPNTAGSSVFGAADQGGLWGNSGTAGGAGQSLFTSGIDNTQLLGSAANLYVVTASSTSATGGNGTPGRLFQAVDLVLDRNGNLQVVATAPVPLPAAVWLLGSGLIGLAGVSRRRRATV